MTITMISSVWEKLKNSFLTPFLFLRYMGSSIVTAAVDYLAFFTSYLLIHNATICIFIGRFFSIVINYGLLRKMVFHSRAKFFITFGKYVLVVLISGLVTSFLVAWMQNQWKISAIFCKMLAEGLLYVINFLILKRIFNNKHLSSVRDPKA